MLFLFSVLMHILGGLRAPDNGDGGGGDKTEQKVEQKAEDKTEQKAEDKTEQKVEQKTEDKVDEKAEQKTEDRAPIIDPAEIAKIREEGQKLREEHEALQKTIQKAREDRRLQIAKGMGVEGLDDAELLGLLPAVDADTQEGRAQIAKWVEAHPALVNESHKTTAPEDVTAWADNLKDNAAIQKIMGGHDALKANVGSGLFGNIEALTRGGKR